MSTAALAAIAAAALAPAAQGHSFGPRHICHARPSFARAAEIRGYAALNYGGDIECRGRVPIDQRLCPQVKLDGHWQFVPGHTCTDTGWSAAYGTGLSGTASCYPGFELRAYVRSWIMYAGKRYSRTVTSRPVTCRGTLDPALG